jgi:hypothetical protein
VLSPKTNHPLLRAEVQAFFADARTFADVRRTHAETVDRDHERIEVSARLGNRRARLARRSPALGRLRSVVVDEAERTVAARRPRTRPGCF